MIANECCEPFIKQMHSKGADLLESTRIIDRLTKEIEALREENNKCYSLYINAIETNERLNEEMGVLEADCVVMAEQIMKHHDGRMVSFCSCHIRPNPACQKARRYV